jgi:hypothetical protein
LSVILVEQQRFRPPLPLVHGCKDYLQQRHLFERIDQILRGSGADQQFLQLSLKHHQSRPQASDGGESWIKHTHCALRVNIARLILNLSCRQMSARLADSALLQWFCHISEFGTIRAPSKSTIHRYAEWIGPEEQRALITHLIQQAGAPAPAPDQPHRLPLREPIDLREGWLDATCLKANIHYPTDWVLLRDATRTLMKATALIRRHGLKARMPQSPEAFLREMNQRAIAMTQTRRQKESRKARKKILRQMAKMQKTIRAHAQRHRDLLQESWSETDLTEAQAQQIIARIDAILEQLPEAIRQARERIIGGRPVPSKDKIHSLYESDIDVIVRGKADAEVEFGNVLRLVEQRQGLIIDWELCQEAVADNASAPFAGCVDRVLELTGGQFKKLWSDRGMDSAQNRQKLAQHEICNGILPKNPAEREAQMAQPGYAEGQKRRASTEGRIGLLKSNFLGRPLRAKGFEHRCQAVGWAVLAHNLWVLARLPEAGSVGELKARAA